MWLRRILAALLGIIIIAAVALAVVAWRPAIAPTESRRDFDPALVARGAALALIGNCNTCHTASASMPYAAGRPTDQHAVRNDLWNQHHAGRADRDRPMVGGRIQARDARGGRSQWLPPLSGVPLRPLHKSVERRYWRHLRLPDDARARPRAET